MAEAERAKGPGSHACIVASQDAGLREEMALARARAHVCGRGEEKPCGVCRHCRLALAGAHPDIIFIDRPLDDKGRPKKEIPVGLIRHMAADAWVRPSEAAKKVYVIKEANRMNLQAQNAALKTLEEPPAYAVFILGTGSPEELLPTIRSRCAVISAPGERAFADDPFAGEYLALAGAKDAAGLCGFFTMRENMDAPQLTDMLSGVRRLLAGYLSGKNSGFGLERRDALRLMRLCSRAEEYLRLNVNVKHVLGMLNVLTERGNQID